LADEPLASTARYSPPKLIAEAFFQSKVQTQYFVVVKTLHLTQGFFVLP
jgi:hypothetical protein